MFLDVLETFLFSGMSANQPVGDVIEVPSGLVSLETSILDLGQDQRTERKLCCDQVEVRCSHLDPRDGRNRAALKETGESVCV